MNKVWGHIVSKRSVCLAFPPSLLLQMGIHKPALSVAHEVDFSPHVGSSLQRIALLFRLIMCPLTATRLAQTAALMFINVSWKRTCERVEVSGVTHKLDFCHQKSFFHITYCMFKGSVQRSSSLPNVAELIVSFRFWGLINYLFDRKLDQIVVLLNLLKCMLCFLFAGCMVIWTWCMAVAWPP